MQPRSLQRILAGMGNGAAALLCGWLGCWVFSGVLAAMPVAEERQDRRGTLRDADHFSVEIRVPDSLEAWKARREQLRRKVEIDAGLWPPPERTPLNARIFDEVQGRGFSVAKVYFESLPGFLVTGNLYRPVGTGPFPAVLTPHGHWKYGRLQNGEAGSIPGRCIDLARQGYVVFSLDMIGYNDSLQFPHDWNKSRAQLRAGKPLPYEPRIHRGDFDFPQARLYGLSLGGLQLWNSIRSLDFLQQLPEVDPTRMGVTGASGGATQSLLLMAVDDRVKTAAPVNIIGLAKHPGCLCENFSGLWIDASTVELAAAFAPRPLLLVSATRDPWTSRTPEVEFPFLQRFFRLWGTEEALGNAHLDAEHNYNLESRMAVYAWFRRHLNPSAPVVEPVPEGSPEVDALGDLRVFPDHVLPENAKHWRQIIADWIAASERTVAGLLQRAEDSLRAGGDLRNGLAMVLKAEPPAPDGLLYTANLEERRGELVYVSESIGRRGADDWIALESIRRDEDPAAALLLCYPEDRGEILGGSGEPVFPWLKTVLGRGFQVFRVRGYASGHLRIPLRTWESFSWPDAYNRSNLLNAVQDVVTALAAVRDAYPELPLTLAGLDECGLPAALGAAVAGGVDQLVVDLDGSDPGYDGELLQRLPVGSIRRVGDLRAAFLAQLLEGDLYLWGAGPTFDPGWLQDRAAALGKGRLEVTAEFNFEGLLPQRGR